MNVIEIAYIESERVSGSALQKTLVWSVKALRETDGRLLWQTRPDQPDGMYLRANTTPGMFYVTGPAFTGVALHHTLYLINVSTHPALMAFDDQSGALLWRRALHTNIGNDATLIVAGSRLYLEQIEQITQVSPQDGAFERSYQTSPVGMPYLVATNNALYIPLSGQAEPTITIADLRASDGQRLWSWDVPRIGSFFPALIFRGAVETSGIVGVVTTVAIYGLRASDGYRLWSWSPPGAFTHPDTDTYTITGAMAG